VGRLVVAEADELREGERGAPVVVELVEQRLRRRAGRRGKVAFAGEPLEQLAMAGPAADVVGAGAPGDRQEPDEHGGVAPVGRGGADGPEVRLLDEVLLLAGRPQAAADAPHGGLGGAHELSEGEVVALDRGGEEVSEVVRAHDPMVADGGGHAISGTAPAVATTLFTMGCEHWIDAISAIADGEEPGVDRRLLDAHLTRCPACRAYQASVESTRSAFRVQPAPAIPDLSRRVVKRNAIADRAARWGIVRGLLAVVAVQLLALGGADLLAAGPADHAVRHLGAFTVAYGVGLLVVVVRPARARAVLPVAAVLGGTLVLSTLVDVRSGLVSAAGELVTHLPGLVSVVLVWSLATPAAGEAGSTLQRVRRRLSVRPEARSRESG
jgi:predicted anti-sigma-YlaC factor YlaD